MIIETDSKSLERLVVTTLVERGVKTATAADIAGWITHEADPRDVVGDIVIEIKSYPASPKANGGYDRSDLQIVEVRDDLGEIGAFVAHPIMQPIAPHLL